MVDTLGKRRRIGRRRIHNIKTRCTVGYRGHKMITRFANLSGRMAITLAFLFGIAACGGGGGGGGNDVGFLPDDGGDSSVYKIDLSITDASGTPTSTVTSTVPVTLTALVTRKNKPVANTVVSARVVNSEGGDTDIATLLPADGTDLTDASGEANFQITAGSTLGAASVEVTVNSPDEGEPPFTETISFKVGQAGLRLGHFETDGFVEGEIGLTASELSVGGSAVLRLDVVDENDDPVATVEEIQLRSGCALSGLASLPASVETTNGQATATYTANGCGGVDEITASLVSSGAIATGTLILAAPEADVIQFESVTPRTIAIKGTGSGERPEKATIVFSVVAGTGTEENPGTPLPGVPVSFSLSTDVGGVSLQNVKGTTDANGFVSTVLRSGSVATTVRVRATIELENGNTVFTTSDAIAITTGLPDQNSISLSSSSLSIEGGLDFDGKHACLTVRMADKFNNPVVDGTQALFTTEYGAVDDACITGQQNGKLYLDVCVPDGFPEVPITGECSVAWISQNPRFPGIKESRDMVRTIQDPDYDCPSHNGAFGPCPDNLGAINGLRTTILVTAEGEEYFVDSNGNGQYDKGESFDNLPEAFVDHNEDRVYTPAEDSPDCGYHTSTDRCKAAGAEETFTDFNNDGVYSFNVDPVTGKGVYNGTLCPEEGDGIWCSRELVNVRDDIVLVMASSSQAEFDIILVNRRTQRVVNGTEEGDQFIAYIADFFNNAPAGGETIEVTPGGDCSILTPTSFTVPDSNLPGAYGIPIETEGDGETGTITITVSDGYSETFGCRSFPPPGEDDLPVSPD